VTRGKWPHEGDAPLVIARKVAQEYRNHLAQQDPELCAHLDRTMADWGQNWVMPRPVHAEPDEWLTVKEAAKLACLEPNSINTLRYRGRLPATKGEDGRWYYLTRDVLALSINKRTRRPRSQQ
jgi:hypothetical protein